MRMLDRRRVMGGALPYDYEVEWLQSTGMNIFTPVIPQTLEYVFKVKLLYTTFISSAYTMMLGTYVDEQHGCYRIIKDNNNYNSVLVWCGNIAGGGAQQVFGVTPGNIYEITLAPTYATFNNTRKNYTAKLYSVVNTSPFRLLGTGCTGRIYYGQIEKSGELIYDGIPVVKDGLPTVYDKISGTFANITGAGMLTPGPRVTGGVVTHYKPITYALRAERRAA